MRAAASGYLERLATSARARPNLAAIGAAIPLAAGSYLILSACPMVMAYAIFFGIAYWIAFALSPFSAGKTMALVTSALAFRLVVGMLLPQIIIYDDEFGYMRMSEKVISGLQFDLEDFWHINPWVNVTGTLYYLFGTSMFVMKAFNSMLGIASAFMLQDTARRLYKDEGTARRTLYACLFLPPVVLLSSIALKEQAVAFLLILILFGSARGGTAGWLLLAIGSVAVIILRSSLGVVIVPLVLVHRVLYINRKRTFSKTVKIIGVGLPLAVMIGGSAYLINHIDTKTLKIFAILSGVDKRGEKVLMRSKAQVNDYVDIENPFSPKNLIVIPVRSVLSPSPFRFVSSPHLSTVFEGAFLASFLYLCFPFVVIAIRFTLNDLATSLPVVMYLCVFLLAGFSALSFAPEPFRYRWPDFPIYAMLAMHGWQYRKGGFGRRAIVTWAVVAGTFTLFYVR